MKHQQWTAYSFGRFVLRLFWDTSISSLLSQLKFFVEPFHWRIAYQVCTQLNFERVQIVSSIVELLKVIKKLQWKYGLRSWSNGYIVHEKMKQEWKDTRDGERYWVLMRFITGLRVLLFFLAVPTQNGGRPISIKTVLCSAPLSLLLLHNVNHSTHWLAFVDVENKIENKKDVFSSKSLFNDC